MVGWTRSESRLGPLQMQCKRSTELVRVKGQRWLLKSDNEEVLGMRGQGEISEGEDCITLVVAGGYKNEDVLTWSAQAFLSQNGSNEDQREER